MRRRLWGVVLGGALLAAPAAGTDDAAELEEIQAAIAERKERLAAYEAREQGLFAAIEAVDRAARALRADARRAAKEVTAAQREQRRLAAEAEGLEERTAATQVSLSRRAVALYKAGEIGSLRWVFGEGSLAERVARVQAIQLLVDHDDQLIRRYAAEREQLELARVGVQEAAARRDAARQRLEKRSNELAEERRTKRRLLIQVRRDRAGERALLNELEAAARELEAALDEFRRAPASGTAGGLFTAAQGNLDPPVQGPIHRPFGRVVDEEYRTQTFRKGVDFEVALGESVYAVAAGEVRFADWFRGYGRMVILDHGDDYFTVSGHLDEVSVAVGDRVAAGDPIGSAGETGSLLGPLLYFEIRKGAEALDPAAWLRVAPGL
jgi:septal ring factor EnvC (AmiA/AmiB activator)